ncbi:MAG: hypothetical protein Q8M31_02595 [Beijerinckiaceae bacterium]|nr:hypothetical protein [Beijerinckiaceae bacterium]
MFLERPGAWIAASTNLWSTIFITPAILEHFNHALGAGVRLWPEAYVTDIGAKAGASSNL